MSTPPEHQATGSHYQPRLGVVLALLLIFVAATIIVLHPSTAAVSSTTSTTTTTSASAAPTTTTTHPPRSRVRVQVANGTLVTGLAHSYTQKLLLLGWDTLTEINAPSATRTLVYFNHDYQWAARLIAQQIGVPSTAVVSLGNSSPVAGASGDDVIVILGPDVSGG